MSIILTGSGESDQLSEPFTEQDKNVMRVLHRLLTTIEGPVNVDALRSHIETNLTEKKATKLSEEAAIVEKLVKLPMLRKDVGLNGVKSIDLDRYQADLDKLCNMTIPKFKNSLNQDLTTLGTFVVSDEGGKRIHAELCYEIQRMSVELIVVVTSLQSLRERMKATMRYAGEASVFLEETKALLEDIALGVERQIYAKATPSADIVTIYTEICNLLNRESKIEKTDGRNAQGSSNKDTASV